MKASPGEWGVVWFSGCALALLALLAVRYVQRRRI